MDRMFMGRSSMLGNQMSSMYGSSGGQSKPFSLIGNMDINTVGMGSSSLGLSGSGGSSMMGSLPSGMMGMGMSNMSVMDQMAKEAEMRRILESDIDIDRRGRPDFGSRRDRDMMFEDFGGPRRPSGLLPAPDIPPLVSNLGHRRDDVRRDGRSRGMGRDRPFGQNQRRDTQRRGDRRYDSQSSSRHSPRSSRDEGRRDNRDGQDRDRGRSGSSKPSGGEKSSRTSSPGSARKRHANDDADKEGSKVAKKGDGDASAASKEEGAKEEKEGGKSEENEDHYCLTCDEKFECTFLEHREGSDHKAKVDPDSKNFCRTCEVNFDGQFLTHRHSDRHKELMEVFLARGCQVCGIPSFSHYMKWKEHWSSIDHKRLEKRAIAAKKIAEIQVKMDTVDPVPKLTGNLETGSVDDDDQTSSAASDDKDGLKQPKSPGMKDTGGEGEKPSSEVAIGQEFVVSVTGYFCKLCNKFYTNETAAKVTHCQTQSHYVKLQNYISSKLKPAKPVASTPKAPSTVAKTGGSGKKQVKGQKKKERTLSDVGVKETQVKESGSEGKNVDSKKEDAAEQEQATNGPNEEEIMKEDLDAKKDDEAKPSEDVESTGDLATDNQDEDDAVTMCDDAVTDPKTEAEDAGNDTIDECGDATMITLDSIGDDAEAEGEEGDVAEVEEDAAEVEDVIPTTKKSPGRKKQVAKRGRKGKK